jgi:hypothetical protein
VNEGLLLGSGVLIGFLGTLLGLGGGFLLVPFLIYLWKFPQPIAVGTSHLVICLNAASGAIAYERQKKIDYTWALLLATAAIPCSWIAAWWIVPRFHSPWFLVAFAGMLGFGAVYVSLRGKLAERETPEEPAPRAMAAGVLIAAASGIVAVTLGIGGGVFYVPTLALVLGRPFHRATATSQFVLLLTSLVAAAQLTWRGQVDLRFAVWLGLGVILGAQAGAALAPRLKARQLRIVFATVVLAVAAKLLWDGVRRLGA